MSHNLDITEGVASFVDSRADAWHQLGQQLDHSFTAEEAMQHGRLGGWNIRKLPLSVEIVEGMYIPVPKKFAVVRDNPVVKGQIDVLGPAVSESYQVWQNEELCTLLNLLVDESGAHFETAGALDGGRRVFVTMKLPGHIKIGGVDRVDMYIAIITSHDGSMSHTIIVTPVRIVCQNTLNAAYQGMVSMFRVRHTKGSRQILIDEARRTLDLSFGYLDSFQEEADKLINTALVQSRFEEIVAKEFGAPEGSAPTTITRNQNKIEKMVELFADAATQDGIRDTAWAGFNAMTEWFDHFSPTRGDDRDTSRAVKAILEPSFKERALNLMLAEV